MIACNSSSRPNIISLKPRNKNSSPLCPHDSNISQKHLQPYFSKKAPMTRSIVLSKQTKQNNVESSIGPGKLKIKLATGNHCKCDKKLRKFEVKEQNFAVSLLGEVKEQPRTCKRAHRISIDLDMLKYQHDQQQLKVGEQEEEDLTCRKDTDSNPLIKKTDESKPFNYSSRCPNEASRILYESLVQQRNQNERCISGACAAIDQELSKCTTNSRDGYPRKSSSKKIREAIMQRNNGRTKSLGIIERSFEQPNHKKESVEYQHFGSSKMQVVGGELVFQNILKGLFAKLTKKNLPYEQWINYLNLSYSELSTEELHFVGLLLQRVEPHYLNSMDFMMFKFKAYQKCRKQLQDLVLVHRKRGTNKIL